MADNNKARIISDMGKAQQRFNALLSAAEKTGKDYTKSLEKQQKLLSQLGRELKDLNSTTQQFTGEQEKSISSISDSYKNFKDSQSDVLDATKSIGNLNQSQREAIGDILSTSRDLSSLSSEDTEQQLAKAEQLNLQFKVAEKLLGKESDILKKIKSTKGERQKILLNFLKKKKM